jgi:hypothetical protein
MLGGAPVQAQVVYSIGHQTSCIDVLSRNIGRRQSCALGQGIDSNPVAECERVTTDIKCVRPTLERVKGARDILRSPDFRWDDLNAELAGRLVASVA